MSNIVAAIDNAVAALQKFKDLSCDDDTGVISLGVRSTAEFLHVHHSSLIKGVQAFGGGSVLEGTRAESQALQASQGGGVSDGVTNNVLTDVQIARLVSYFGSEAKRVSSETRQWNQTVLMAAAAIGIRALGYQALGRNPDYTPVAAKPKRIQSSELVQINKRKTQCFDGVEAALKHLGIDYFMQIKYMAGDGISHAGYQKLDFYCPDIGEYGLAIKTYYQNGGGSGYEKLCLYKDEIVYRYPCPAILIVSGDYMNKTPSAQNVLNFIRSFEGGKGKLRQVIHTPKAEIQNVIENQMASVLKVDRRGDRHKRLQGTGRRLMGVLEGRLN